MDSTPSQFDRALAMWKQIDFPLIAGESRGLAFVDCMRELYDNGQVIHKTFAIPEHADFDAFVRNHQLHGTFFFERFWKCPSVAAALPYLPKDLNYLDQELFRYIHPVELPGDLARTLTWGGAYNDGPPGREALEIARPAADSLLNHDFDYPQVYVASAA